MEVVAEAGRRRRARWPPTPTHRPDVTLLDLRMPGMSGPEVITGIRAGRSPGQIIVLTTYDADEDVFRAVQAGARGYLLKGTFPEGMLEAGHPQRPRRPPADRPRGGRPPGRPDEQPRR